jgi:hypothetical protein
MNDLRPCAAGRLSDWTGKFADIVGIIWRIDLDDRLRPLLLSVATSMWLVPFGFALQLVVSRVLVG